MMNGSAILQNFISVMDSFLVLYLGRTVFINEKFYLIKSLLTYHQMRHKNRHQLPLIQPGKGGEVINGQKNLFPRGQGSRVGPDDERWKEWEKTNRD